MRPENLKTKIFLYSADISETQEAQRILGFLDGQTTNPKLISKLPDLQKRLSWGKKYTKEEFFKFYKQLVERISHILSGGVISMGIYADHNTTAKDLLDQAKEASAWAKNVFIKFPITQEGLLAAKEAAGLGIKIVMSHCFTQEQAQAVYAVTSGAQKGQFFIAPRIERLCYGGFNGMDIVKNIIEMYKKGDGHVGIFVTDIGNIDHLLYSLSLGVDVLSAPLRILKVWCEKGLKVPDPSFKYDVEHLKPILYKELDLSLKPDQYNIQHELTDTSIREAYMNWKTVIQ